jgi:putative transposase
MKVFGFVVMPEHVHLLISEPERGTVANAMQSLKIASAKRGKRNGAVRADMLPFWQKRYYDRNESEHKEFIERPKYIQSQPGEAQAGGETGRLEMEQLSPLCQRRRLRGED